MTATIPLLARRLAIGGFFAVGVAGSVATSSPSADLSGFSEDVRLALDAETPDITLGATATAESSDAIAAGTGQIGLSLSFDATATGSISYSLVSNTTGERTDGDVVDPQSQGELRAAIDAFNECSTGTCAEDLTITLSRTDVELEGTTGLTLSLDGVASLAEEGGDLGSITFDIDG